MKRRNMKDKRVETGPVVQVKRPHADKETEDRSTTDQTDIDRVEKALTMLMDVCARRCDQEALRTIDGLRSMLDKLRERIIQHHLSEAAIHKTLHEVRLDAILLSSQTIIRAIYDHQIVIAPRSELREQIRADHPELVEWYDHGTESTQHVRDLLQGQLEVLHRVNDILYGRHADESSL